MQFCRQSRGSIYELIDDFIECFDCGYMTECECKELKEEAYNLIKMLNAYIAKTRQMKKDYENSK